MIADRSSAEEIDVQCAELGRILGLAEPVPVEVLRAALRDSTYAHNLLVSRGERRFLDRLLAHPPAQPEETQPSLTELAKSAASSLTRWARTGFSTVDAGRYARRLEACAVCPHLSVPPSERRLLYAAAGARPHARSVCAKCGCVVANKARRPLDTCPDPSPDSPGVNRWGDPLSHAASAPEAVHAGEDSGAADTRRVG